MIRSGGSNRSTLRNFIGLAVVILLFIIVFRGCPAKNENSNLHEKVQSMRVTREELVRTNEELQNFVKTQEKIESLELDIQRKKQEIEELEDELQQTVIKVLR